MTHARRCLIALGVGLGLLAGCEQQSTQSTTTTTQPASGTPTAAELQQARSALAGEQAATTPELPPGHPPIDAAAMQQAAEGTGAAPAIVTYDAPAGWVQETPSRRERTAQFQLPASEGSSGPGELAVYYFGPNAGGVEANLARWRGQFTTADGQPVPDSVVTRDAFEANGLKVTYYEVLGQYHAGMMAGGAGSEPQANCRLLGAIVETPDGPWFFKATGPDATMQAQRANFRKFLESVHVAQ